MKLNKKAQNYIPLFYALLILFAIGILFNFVVQSFDNTLIPTPEPPVSTAIDFIRFQQNFSVDLPFVAPITPFNLWGSFGDAIAEFVVSQLLFMSLIPNIILVPLILFGVIALVWTIVKLVLP